MVEAPGEACLRLGRACDPVVNDPWLNRMELLIRHNRDDFRVFRQFRQLRERDLYLCSPKELGTNEGWRQFDPLEKTSQFSRWDASVTDTYSVRSRSARAVTCVRSDGFFDLHGKLPSRGARKMTRASHWFVGAAVRHESIEGT